MRLLIYLLAMLTGISVAEAARPVSPSPATLGSAVSSAAVVSATVSLQQQQVIAIPMFAIPTLEEPSNAPVSNVFTNETIVIRTPVTAHDVTLQ